MVYVGVYACIRVTHFLKAADAVKSYIIAIVPRSVSLTGVGVVDVGMPCGGVRSQRVLTYLHLEADASLDRVVCLGHCIYVFCASVQT